MKPVGHVAISSIISLFVWASFRSWPCALASFLAGVFIDLDHLIDYYSCHAFTVKAKDVYDACAEMSMKKLYLFLHSYEIMFLMWAAIYIFSLPDIWKAAAIGMTQHLILDQVTNPITIPGYFLTYRMLNGFKKEAMLRQTKGIRWPS